MDDDLEVTIASLTTRGWGIAPRSGQKRVEVPCTLPGERVRISFVGKSRRALRGRLLEVVEPAPERTTPRCPHVGECGGCAYQHINYLTQSGLKEQCIKKLFADLDCPNDLILPIIVDPDPWRYRNKMEFTFSASRDGEQFLGLCLIGQRRVAALQECHLTPAWFLSALKIVRHWQEEHQLVAYRPYRDEGSLRTLTIREGARTQEKLLMLTLSGRPEYALSADHKSALASRLAKEFGSELSLILQTQVAVKGCPTRFEQEILLGKGYYLERLELPEERPLEFRVSPTAFFQPNTRQAERLYSHCLELAEIGENDRVLDLCCGTGTLTLVAALRARQVLGIELEPTAVEDARENARRNGLDNATFEVGDVGQLLPQIMATSSWDVCLIDPPRAGIPKPALECLGDNPMKRLLYVSCNPITQVADIAFLLERGYSIKAVQPLDQFAHTPHVENMVLLEGPSG